MTKKALITGGLGWVGSALVNKLKELNYNVDIIDLKNGRDIRTDKLEGKYDIVFHLAALRSVPKSFDNPREYFDTNVYGTYRICEAFKDTRIVNISTSSANNPIAPYGLSKLLAEKIAEEYNKVVSLRLFNPFGEGELCTDLVIPIFAKAMLKNEQVYIHSTGNQSRDFTYLDDVLTEIIYYGNSQDEGLYDVGYNESHSINEVFKIMAKYFKYKKELVYLPRRIGDQIITQAQDELHHHPIGFYEGLKRTMEWYAKNIISS
jgi:nucleoside-diphosphate-sugar epimerase